MTGRALRRAWRVGGQSFEADLQLEDDHLLGVIEGLDGQTRVEARVHRTARDAVTVRIDGGVHRAVLARQGSTLWVAVDGYSYALSIASAGATHGAGGSDRFALSPMTGVLIQVKAHAGLEVAEGDVLFVVEAMKMEYAVRAPRDAVVAHVEGSAGDRVDVNDPVVTFEDPT